MRRLCRHRGAGPRLTRSALLVPQWMLETQGRSVATSDQAREGLALQGEKRMTALRKIDVHAHILSEETMSLMRKEAPKIGPRLERIDDDFAVLEVAGSPYRPFPRGGWDMSRRLSDMDAAGVDVQVVSNTPQTFLYNQESAGSPRHYRPCRTSRSPRPSRTIRSGS